MFYHTYTAFDTVTSLNFEHMKHEINLLPCNFIALHGYSNIR